MPVAASPPTEATVPEPKVLSNYIGGAFVDPSTGAYLDDVAPATSEPIARVPCSDETDVGTSTLTSMKRSPRPRPFT